MEQVSKITEKYLDHFKFFPSHTLWDLDLAPAMKLNRCPYDNCGNKLRTSRKGHKFCNSKKHPHFFMRKEKFEKFI